MTVVGSCWVNAVRVGNNLSELHTSLVATVTTSKVDKKSKFQQPKQLRQHETTDHSVAVRGEHLKPRSPTPQNIVQLSSSRSHNNKKESTFDKCTNTCPRHLSGVANLATYATHKNLSCVDH